MAFCKTCGKEVNENQAVCLSCGASLETKPAVIDNGGFGWSLLGFCFPLIGLILYLVWKDEKPITSLAVGKGALISVILSVVLYVLYIILIFALAASGSI